MYHNSDTHDVFTLLDSSVSEDGIWYLPTILNSFMSKTELEELNKNTSNNAR